MRTFTFHQVECPKCHGPLSSTAQLSGEVTCPFCGTAYSITANVTGETEMPEQIVPFTTSMADFELLMRKMLAGEDYAPVNISELIPFKRIKGIYFPAYLYRGQYECSWSCRIRQANADGDTEHKETYRPQNGVSGGEYAFVCMACEGVESGRELAEYIRTMDCRGNFARQFVPDDLNEHCFLQRTLEERSVWKQWGSDSLENIVRNDTLIQLKSSDIRDFKCRITQDLPSQPQFILFPVWMINFQYDGQPQHIFMDGTGRNGVKGTTLTDRALKARAEKPFTILKFIAAAAILIPLVMLPAALYLYACIALVGLWLIFFTFRLFAIRHRKNVIRKARLKRENS